MSWASAKEAAKKSGGGGKFVSLKDGETVTVVFRGEPREYFQKFGDPTEYDKPGENRGFKFKINVVTKNDEGKKVSKIFSGGKQTFTTLVALIEKLGADYVYDISRVGAGKKNTTYLVMPKGPLNVDQLEEINAVALQELVPKPRDVGEDPRDAEKDVPL